MTDWVQAFAAIALSALFLRQLYIWSISPRNKGWPVLPRKPFIGSLGYVRESGKLSSPEMRKMMNASTWSIKIGLAPEMLAVTSVKDVKEFESHDPHIGNRPRLMFFEKELAMHDDFMPTEDTSPAMLAKRKAVVSGVQQMLITTNQSKNSGLERACRQLLTDIDAKVGQGLLDQDLIDLAVPCVGIMGISLSFGLRWNDENGESVKLLVEQLTKTLQLLGMTKNPYMPFPFLKYIMPGPYNEGKAKASEILRKVHKAREDLYQQAVSLVEKEGIEALEPSTLKSILSDPDRQGLPHLDILSSVAAALGGSTDTSSHSLAVVIAALAAYPEYQTKIREQLKENNITSEDMTANGLRDQVPLMLAFLRETFRLYGIFHLTGRKTTADIIVDEKLVHKNTPVVYDWYSINRDPDFYGDDVDDFKPERFGKDAPSFGKHGHGTFGFGRRRCPGSDLAETFILFAMANIMLNYNISFKDEGPLGKAALKPIQSGALWSQEHRPLVFTRL